jgi:glycosyltransferase involved in cell wall biosynthesis
MPPAEQPTSITVTHVVTVPCTLEFLSGQAAFMRQRGVELSFVSSSGPEQLEFGATEATNVITIEMSRQITPFRDFASLWRLCRLLAVQRPTLVHAHTPKAGLLTMIAAVAMGVRGRIYHIHGLPFETATGWRRMLQLSCDWLACTLARRVLAVSPSVEAAVIQHRLCSRSKIAVPGPGSIGGIDAESFFNPELVSPAEVRNMLGIPLKAPLIGFVGRLVKDKGVEDLWQAFRRLRRQRPDAHLLIVGPKDDSRSDQSLPDEVIAELQDDSQVHMVGAVPRRELPKYYRAMDLLCLPTYREGFPVTLLEAAAMSLPTVTTRATGCLDAVVSDETGLVVNCGDVASLELALRKYLGDRNLRRRHGNAARRRVVERFTPNVVCEALALEYAALANVACGETRSKRGSVARGARPTESGADYA